MQKLLEKIKLIAYLTTELEIDKITFVAKLKEHIASSDLDMFSDISDVFSSNTYEHKGIVTTDHFKIKRRRRMFDMALNMAVAEGSYIQKDSKLIIETKITGASVIMIAVFGFILLIYVLIIGGLIINVNFGEDALNSVFVLLFMLFHASLMIGIPYLIMRAGVKKLKYELEREFFYVTKH